MLLRAVDSQVITELARSLKGFEDCTNVGRFMLIPFSDDGKISNGACFDHCYFTYSSAKRFRKIPKRSSGQRYCCWLVPPFDTIGAEFMATAEEIDMTVDPLTFEVTEMRIFVAGREVARWPDREGFFEEIMP